MSFTWQKKLPIESYDKLKLIEHFGLTNMNTATTALPIKIVDTRSTPRVAQTAAYFAAFIALGLSTGSLGPTLPALAIRSRVSLGVVSYLFTARSLGYVMAATKGARLFDRHNGNPVMAAMLVLMAAMMALTPLTASFWLLFGAMFLLGAGEATLDVGANTLLVWVHANRVAPVMNALHSCFGIGALAAPIIVAAVVSFQRNAVDTYFVLAVMLLPIAGWLLRVPSPAAQSKVTDQALRPTSRVLLLLFALFLFLYVGAEVGFGGWIFTYSATLRLATPATAAYLTSVFWGALTIGRLVAVPLASRFRHRTILFADLSGSLLSVILIFSFSDSFAVTLLGTFGVGFFMASVFPTVLSLAGNSLSLTGAVTGRFIVGASAGAMTVPLLIGQLFEPVGPQVVMYVVSGALLLAAATLTYLLLRTSRIQQAEARA